MILRVILSNHNNKEGIRMELITYIMGMVAGFILGTLCMSKVKTPKRNAKGQFVSST